VKTYLRSAEVLRWFDNEVPGEKIDRETHANLQGAPLADLRKKLDKRGPYLESMGAIPKLAQEIGERWQAAEATRLEAERLHHAAEFNRWRERVLDHQQLLRNAWESFQQAAAG